MDNVNYSISARRRALNIIWTAAGDYHFEPAFMAFTQDGQPDFYMDSIIGYVKKWYDGETMRELFDTIGSSFMRETFDGILWVGLENCAFEREVRSRPVLAELRLSCAESFFERQQENSRQQWMAQNSLVYALQSARWNTVLGKEPGLVSPYERRLFRELSYSGDWDAKQIAEHTYRLLAQFFHFRKDGAAHSLLLKLKHKFSKASARRLPSRVMRAEDLIFAKDGTGNGMVTPGKSKGPGILTAAEEESNRIYIENCFGLPLFGREELSRLDALLCTGSHEACHVYFTSGERPAHSSPDALIQKAIRGARAQAEQNAAHYRQKQHFYQNCITRLAQQIRNAMLVYPQPLHVMSRSGQIAPEQVWRAVALNDDCIFTDKFEEEQPDFSVDLMLDASASRLESQEVIASQAYVIAHSLRLCKIPVQVYSFLTIRGYTVLRLFCGYNDSGRDETVFDYFAAGWNRDGLALREAGFLLQDSPAKNRLLVILTDASPNDDRKIPPDYKNGQFMSRDYSGEAGIDDTLSEVRALKKRGIQVMAILNGSDGNTEAARKIYGDDFVRIENIRHLSEAAGTLLQRQIEKMHM